MTTGDFYSWIGYRMRSPEGREGTVYRDDNWGAGRTLYINFDDGTQGRIELNNVGDNPPETQEWEWWYETQFPSQGNEEGDHWVKWGR